MNEEAIKKEVFINKDRNQVMRCDKEMLCEGVNAVAGGMCSRCFSVRQVSGTIDLTSVYPIDLPNQIHVA